MLICETCGEVSADEIENIGSWRMHLGCGSEVRENEAEYTVEEPDSAAGGRDVS
jgi:hypothetical protein